MRLGDCVVALKQTVASLKSADRLAIVFRVGSNCEEVTNLGALGLYRSLAAIDAAEILAFLCGTGCFVSFSCETVD